MILHLLGEAKFDSLIMNQMEECFPGGNLFLLFCDKRSLDISEQCYTDRILFQEDLLSIDYKDIEGIIVHYLSIPKAIYLSGVPKKIPIACSIWGGDFYNFLPEYKRNLYGEVTRKYLYNCRKYPWIIYKLNDFLHFPVSRNYNLWKRVVKNSKIYSTVIPNERKLTEKYFKKDTEYMFMPTHSLEKVIDTNDYLNTVCTKENYQKNILIGNSGNLTNNHLEILNFVSKFKDAGINVHLPLTYGDDQYIKHLCKIGYSILGNNFFPLLRHMYYKDYFSFINSFNICIFNSYRQQGVGTINLALWCGGKVYLSNKNITSSFYKDIGLKIFSIENDFIPAKSVDLFTPLTNDEIIANRRCLLKLYSGEVVNNSIKRFVDKFKSKSFTD